MKTKFYIFSFILTSLSIISCEKELNADVMIEAELRMGGGKKWIVFEASEAGRVVFKDGKSIDNSYEPEESIVFFTEINKVEVKYPNDPILYTFDYKIEGKSFIVVDSDGFEGILTIESGNITKDKITFSKVSDDFGLIEVTLVVQK